MYFNIVFSKEIDVIGLDIWTCLLEYFILFTKMQNRFSAVHQLRKYLDTKRFKYNLNTSCN